MCRCDICGTEQKKIGEVKLSIGDTTINNVPTYNIDFSTYIQGKRICDGCMDTYHKIHAMIAGIDFSCGGKEYYADGRNLDEYRTNFTGGTNEHQICEETQRTNKIRWNGY